MRFVPVKTVEQQDVQAIHRVRCTVMSQRNAKPKQIRVLVAEYEIVAPRQIEQIAKDNPVTRRLQQLRGVGPMVATALVATVGDGSHFRKGRQMAAAIGLTPRQHSTGDKRRLLGISKCGDAYLRTLLIHGARAVVSQAKRRDDPVSLWVTRIAERSHTNVVAAALANKTVRIAWSMLRNESDYKPALAGA